MNETFAKYINNQLPSNDFRMASTNRIIGITKLTKPLTNRLAQLILFVILFNEKSVFYLINSKRPAPV